tara:strand:- start:219 stop:1292 length:1074 start_codon:yes stop_codon:yes gene_type:complete
MLAYNLFFLLSFISIFNQIKFSKNIESFFYLIIFFSLSIFIGLRHEVGGDWINYQLSYAYITKQNFKEFISSSVNYNEFGYKLIIFICNQLSNKYMFYISNYISAFIFLFFYINFIKNFNYKSLLFFFSIPYLIIVVSMGYTRQSIAIGFLLFGLLNLKKNQDIKFIFIILLGSMFHKTILFGLTFLVIKHLNFKKDKIYLILLLIFFILIPLYINNFIELASNFLSQKKIETTGATIRLFINFLIAIIYFYIRKGWDNSFYNKKLMDYSMSLMIIFFFFSFFLAGPIISAFDRISVYLFPFNLIVISNLITRINSNNGKVFCGFIVILFSYLFFLIWANYGGYSHHWFPYQNLLFL